MSYYKYVPLEDSEKIRHWAHSDRPHALFSALPLLTESFDTPIATMFRPIRAEILGNEKVRSNLKSILDAIMTGEIQEAIEYWEEFEEDFYPFIDTLDVKYRFGTFNMIVDLVDLLFGAVLHLGSMGGTQLRFYNLLLEMLYDGDKNESETSLQAMVEHQQDLVHYLVDGFDNYLEVMRDLNGG